MARPRPLPLFMELLRSETAAFPERMEATLAGVKAYQEAKRVTRPNDMPVIAEAGRARLLDYGAKDAAGPVAVFVPSLINPPWVLDLAEGNSLLRWLAEQGVRPLLVDWGAPAEGEAELTVAGHVETMLLPMLEQLGQETGERAHLIGYCLGGTMATGAAAQSHALSLTTIASPWRFDGFPDEARDGLRELWKTAAPMCEMLGALPMEILQTAFWKLDPTRTVSKFEKFGRLEPCSDNWNAFIALEDWANDGAPLTFGAARELIGDMFIGNATGEGRWQVAGELVDPDALPCASLDIISSTDRIVPEATAARAGQVMTLAQGHVGMVVGGRGRKALWEPLTKWLQEN